MKKVLFKNFTSSGYLIVEFIHLELIIIRLKDLNYFDIEVV